MDRLNRIVQGSTIKRLPKSPRLEITGQSEGIDVAIQGKTILIFDPEIEACRKYRLALSNAGYHVITAAEIDEVLECIKHRQIHLVVMELEFPAGSGLDYLYDIMNQDRSIKVLINSDFPEYKYDFHTWTADAFLSKNAGIPALKRHIKKLLSEKTNRTFRINKFTGNS